MSGKVNFFDLSQVLGYKYNAGGTTASYTDGDLNYDGKVNFFDLSVVLSANYNGAPFSSPAAALPATVVVSAPSSPAPTPAPALAAHAGRALPPASRRGLRDPARGAAVCRDAVFRAAARRRGGFGRGIIAVVARLTFERRSVALLLSARAMIARWFLCPVSQPNPAGSSTNLRCQRGSPSIRPHPLWQHPPRTAILPPLHNSFQIQNLRSQIPTRPPARPLLLTL